MNFVNQLEDYLRDLGAEARKKNPGVKEASERAILKLRTLQNQYVSAVRKASTTEGEKHPDTSLFRSSDLLHPFLLAANYPNASPKLLDISFRAMKSLMEADAICPGDGMNMVRVWMIQALVVVSYSKNSSGTSGKDNLTGAGTASATLPKDSTLRTSTSSETKNLQTESKATSSSSSSSSLWFGSYFSSSSASSTTGQSKAQPISSSASSAAASAAAAASSTISKMTTSVTTKTAVSSSHGQAGSGNLNGKDLEKIALDILSCLLQLLELKDLLVSTEQWIQSVTLCCLLYLPQLRQNVQQAARSTLPQVLTLLLKDETASQLATKTWDDLLTCSLGFSSSSTLEKGKIPSLNGAFSHCRLGEKDSAQPPSPSFSLELLTLLLSESPDSFFDTVASKTFGVIVQVLQNQSKIHSNALPVDFLKALQFSLIILQTQGNDYQMECRELIIRLIQPIALATEALRKQAEFEDGYIYKVPTVKQLGVSGPIISSKGLSAPAIQSTPKTPSGTSTGSAQGSTAITMPNQKIETLQALPPTVLWKAALAMETLKSFIYHDNQKKRSSTTNVLDSSALDSSKIGFRRSSTFRTRELWLHEDVVGQVLEATSDFCTIGASCEEHMILLILACRASAVEAKSLSYSAESLDSIEQWQRGKNSDNAYVLGEALWAGLNALLRMIDQLEDTALEQAFAPSLSVLQHYLKRFPASGTIVKRSLEGYFSLAKVSLNLPLFRRALLASLCKLSLPQWGSNDPCTKLKDHNIAALICLLNIVHRQYNSIGPEWSLVLQTFDELSSISIASPHLSNSAYAGALSVSAVYGRFASFSACLSDEAISHFIAGLKEVAMIEKASSTIPNPIDGSDIQVPDRASSGSSQDDRPSISGKLMTIGARAIAWNNDTSSQPEDVPVAERTKSTYYDDYQMDFVNRVSSSKHEIRNKRVTFSVALLADAAMVNSFRHGHCCSKIFDEFCCLAAESSSARLFLVDMLTMLTMNHISKDRNYPVSFVGPAKIMYPDPRQNQYLAVEKTDRGQFDSINGEQSQLDVLGPLCDCIMESKVCEMAELGLEALFSVLESTGHRLVADSWIKVIEAIASAAASETRSSDEWSDTCQVGFRCLKLIVDDFLEDAASTAQTELLDCCSAFGSSRQDVNTSLTAIGLLWSIADQDTSTESVDRALAKLVLLSDDNRPEVRNCAVNTLFSCIVGRGSTFSVAQWESCLTKTIFALYDAVTSNDVSEVSGLQTCKSQKKSRYTVAVHHTRDSSDKQWLATRALVLQGLCRLLRNFFSNLLDTTDEGVSPNDEMAETPWFDSAWSTILDYAFDASTQVGGRDTVELRTSGVELLVVCNQLSCAAGIQPAISPARVGTNMEVVNGALRSVRTPEKSQTGANIRRTHSAVTEIWRENLFKDAFYVLDSLHDHFEEEYRGQMTSNAQVDATQIQVLTKLAQELSKLYDCCMNSEFAEDKSLSYVETFEPYFVSVSKPPADDDAMTTRFVRLVTTVASCSSSGPDSRFLSQAQRSCMDILRKMASDGSPEGLLSLVSMAGPVFFLEKEPDGKPKKGVEILSHEATNALASSFASDRVSDECKVLVLTQLLSKLLEQQTATSESKHFSWYKDFVPIMQEGLKSAKTTSTDASGPMMGLLNGLWKRVSSVLSHLLSPSSDRSKWKSGIPHASELIAIVDAVSENAPPAITSHLCVLFVSGSKNCLDAASALNSPSDHRVNEALGLFAACVAGTCRIQQCDVAMQDVAKEVLSSAVSILSTSSSTDEAVDVQAAMKICEVLPKIKEKEDFVMNIFPALARLVSMEQPSLRKAAGGVLATCRVNEVVLNARRQKEEAEKRADRAEKRVAELERLLEQLEKEKDALEHTLA